jgi:hypothetical protein
MGTKSIQDVLEWAQQQADHLGDDGYWNQCISARAELEAIRKAVEDAAGELTLAVNSRNAGSTNGTLVQVCNRLRSIAKEES